jgi:hypothetical protein
MRIQANLEEGVGFREVCHVGSRLLLQNLWPCPMISYLLSLQCQTNIPSNENVGNEPNQTSLSPVSSQSAAALGTIQGLPILSVLLWLLISYPIEQPETPGTKSRSEHITNPLVSPTSFYLQDSTGRYRKPSLLTTEDEANFHRLLWAIFHVGVFTTSFPVAKISYSRLPIPNPAISHWREYVEAELDSNWSAKYHHPRWPTISRWL